MLFNRNKNNDSNSDNNDGKKKKKIRSYDGVVDLSKMIFKKRDYKIEKREVTKDEKKAIIITAVIIIGIGLLLWFLPATHQFFEDFLLLKF